MVHDTRDNALDPSQGHTASFNVDYAGLSGRRGNQFVRSSIKMTTYVPVYDDIVLATGVRAGVAFTYAGTDVLPVQERFYLGGPDVMRGYRYHGLRTQTDSLEGAPAGGNVFVACNIIELRMPWWGPLGGVAFCDGAGLWRRAHTRPWEISQEAFVKGLRINPGFGLRIESFIGVLRADCGFRLNPRKKRDLPLAVHVGIGQAF
jgi:outer membrane protein insertion porin family